MTLKKYLEEQIYTYAKAKQSNKADVVLQSNYSGVIQAYTNILLVCPDSVLDRNIGEV